MIFVLIISPNFIPLEPPTIFPEIPIRYSHDISMMSLYIPIHSIDIPIDVHRYFHNLFISLIFPFKTNIVPYIDISSIKKSPYLHRYPLVN